MTERQLDGVGWSLSHALDGANRRAKPKAPLSRYRAGHRVAGPDTAPSSDAVHMARASDRGRGRVFHPLTSRASGPR